MDHYESMVIILNAQLGIEPASFTWKRSRTAFFACRFEKPTESESFWVIVTSPQEAVGKMLLDAAQSVLDVLSRLENTLTRYYIHELALPYRGFYSLCTRLPRGIEMFTKVLWQHLFQVQKVPDKKNMCFVKQVVISKL